MKPTQKEIEAKITELLAEADAIGEVATCTLLKANDVPIEQRSDIYIKVGKMNAKSSKLTAKAQALNWVAYGVAMDS